MFLLDVINIEVEYQWFCTRNLRKASSTYARLSVYPGIYMFRYYQVYHRLNAFDMIMGLILTVKDLFLMRIHSGRRISFSSLILDREVGDFSDILP